MKKITMTEKSTKLFYKTRADPINTFSLKLRSQR
jgi:hypothetical protein